MANQVEVLFFGDSRALQRAVRDAEKSFGSFNKSARTMADRAKDAGATLNRNVTLPLGALGVAAIKSASDQEQAFGAIESVAGDAADIVRQFGETAARSYGLSQEQVSRLGAVTVAQLQSFGFSNERAAETTVELQQRAADLAATFGGPVEDAVSAIGALLRGERDPIERYGVAIKQADVNARLAADGLDQLEGEERRLAEAQAALTLLMEQTSGAAGQFGREVETTAGQTAIAAAEAKELAAELGETLLPIATNVLGTVADVAEAFGNLPDPMQDMIVYAGLGAAALGPLLTVGGNIATVWPKVAGAVKTVTDALTVGNVAAQGAATSLGGVATSSRSVLGVLGPVGLAAGVLGAAFVALRADQKDLQEAADEYTATLDTQTDALTDNTRATAVKRLQDSGAFDAARKFGIELDLVTDAVLGNASAQAELGSRLETAEWRYLQAGGSSRGFAQASVDLTSALRDESAAVELTIEQAEERREANYGVSESADAVVQAAAKQEDQLGGLRAGTSDLSRATDDLASATGDATDAAGDHADALGDEEDGVRSLTDAVSDHADAQRAATDPVFAAIDAQRDLRNAQQELIDVQGDDSASKDDLRRAQDDLVRAAIDAEGAIADLGASVVDGTTSVAGMRDRLEEIDGLPQDVVDQIMGEFETLAPRARAEANIIGREASAGVAEGVEGSQAAIRDALIAATMGAVDAAKLAARIRSPSQETAEEIGQPLSEGIAEGIEDSAEDVYAALEAVVDEAVERAQGGLSAIQSGFRAQFRRDDAQEDLAGAEAELARLQQLPLEVSRAEKWIEYARSSGRVSAEKLNEAEERLTELREEASGLPEKLADAQRDLVEAQLAAVAAEQNLLEAGADLIEQGPDGEASFRRLAEAAGVEADAVDRLIDGYRVLARTRGGGGGLSPELSKAIADERARLGLAEEAESQAFWERQIGTGRATLADIEAKAIDLGKIGSRHTGGIIDPASPGRVPGLRANERLTALEVGEEVLTADDPRHADNLARSPRPAASGTTAAGGDDTRTLLRELVRETRATTAAVRAQATTGTAGPSWSRDDVARALADLLGLTDLRTTARAA